MNKLQENIENIRKEQGIKQTEMADLLGIKQSSYSAYVSKNSDIKYSTLTKIAHIFKISIIDLITYPERYVNVQELKECESCKEKDKIIKNLNDYIEVLKYKLEHKK